MATVVLFMSPVFDLKSKQSRWKATWLDFILQGSLAALQRIDRWGKVGGDGGPVDVERAIVSQGGSGSGSFEIKGETERDRSQGHFRRSA